MKHFTSVYDVHDINQLVNTALQHKANPHQYSGLGKGKTLGLIFMNPSLRTRLSTQVAAQRLGLNVIVMNMDKDGWALELNDGAVMNGSIVEHIKDAAAVLSAYCDIIGFRSFAQLRDREADDAEVMLNQLKKYARVPVISLESCTLHPLQSLADLVTIIEHTQAGKKPKVVLTWAPHVKPLPQAVANSFAQWITAADMDLTITHPEGVELDTQFTKHARVEYDQHLALADADFVYVKNWSSYQNYGTLLQSQDSWMLTPDKLHHAPHAHIMHCMPLRRNVELSDAVADSEKSLIHAQASNRVWAAQAVLHHILNTLTYGK